MAKRLAVLIDAENASAVTIGAVLKDVSALGVADIRRIYGDFTNQNMTRWRPILLEHAIQPIQQFCNTTGKSVTDGALIIDAMDLLHTRELDGFCLVSSDGDFTRLATRIREDGLAVYGFGEGGKTSQSFVRACSRFTRTETLIRSKQSSKGPAPSSSTPARLQGGQSSPNGTRPSR